MDALDIARIEYNNAFPKHLEIEIDDAVTGIMQNVSTTPTSDSGRNNSSLNVDFDINTMFSESHYLVCSTAPEHLNIWACQSKLASVESTTKEESSSRIADQVLRKIKEGRAYPDWSVTSTLLCHSWTSKSCWGHGIF